MTSRRPTPSDIAELNIPRLDNIIDLAETEFLGQEQRTQLKSALHTLTDWLLPESRNNEKLTNVAGLKKRLKSSEPAPGHGRHKASDYEGATKVVVTHPDLTSGCACPDPECRGKVYTLNSESKNGVSPLVRIIAMAPLQATRYECQKLRCNICETVYTAPPPEGVGPDKYDESVASMVAVFRYGLGLPLYRLEGLQGYFKVPLPVSTQWDLIADAAEVLQPLNEELAHQAAQADVLSSDDTGVRILRVQRAAGDKRTGLHTTGIVATNHEGERPIAVYSSGTQHAGENLRDLLALRSNDTKAPILMSDALSWNTSKLSDSLEALIANCLAHGRRKFVTEYSNCPDECLHILTELGKVYLHDQEAREQRLNAQDRMKYHQAKSEPIMKALHKRMTENLKDQIIEPNSGMGKSIQYMLTHWKALTLFLRQPGAPLDNNRAERALKKAVLHRRNSLFYKTLNGAQIGDLFMSLIHTCELNHVNPFAYLTEALRRPEEIRAQPDLWMPWNYQAQLAPAPD